MVEFEKLTRVERLLVLAAVQIGDVPPTGHNTTWAECVDLVLEGRRGLFDYSDDELLTELELHDEHDGVFSNEEGGPLFASNAELVEWARKLSNIGKVEPDARYWAAASFGEQEQWRKEDRGA